MGAFPLVAQRAQLGWACQQGVINPNFQKFPGSGPFRGTHITHLPLREKRQLRIPKTRPNSAQLELTPPFGLAKFPLIPAELGYGHYSPKLRSGRETSV